MAGRPMLGSGIKLRAFALKDEGLSLRKIAERLSADMSPGLPAVSHGSVRNWLNNDGLKAAYARREKHAADKLEAPPVLKLAVVEGELGWTPKSEALYMEGLCSGASKRISAHLAGLTEHDVDGWAEEAARGVEPFVSAMRRIRAGVASEVVAVSSLVKGGMEGYQARIRWLAAVDPDNWSDKPRKSESEQDRAAGMTDSDLYEVLDIEPAQEVAS